MRRHGLGLSGTVVKESQVRRRGDGSYGVGELLISRGVVGKLLLLYQVVAESKQSGPYIYIYMVIHFL